MKRIDESRQMVRDELMASFGVYVKAEPNQRDTWRDATFWQLWQHLLHEVEEVRQAKTAEAKYHNLLDLTALGAICAAKQNLGQGIQ